MSSCYRRSRRTFQLSWSLKSDRAEWIDSFSQSRKIGYSFILVAQNDRMIDKQIRGLIEYEMVHRKINRFGPFKMLPFTIFVCVEKWYIVKQKVSAECILFHKSVAAHYDTYAMFTEFKLSQALLDKITNIRAPVPENMQVPVTAIFDKSGTNE